MLETTSDSSPQEPPKTDIPPPKVNQPLIDRVLQLVGRGQFNAAALLLPTLERRGVDPGFVQAMAASIALARGDRDAAERIIDVALSDHPANSALLCLKAEMRLAERLWVDAALASADAIIAEPHHAGAKSALGRALLELGKAEQATTCLLEALETMPHDLPTLTGLSRAAPSEAEAVLTKLVDEDSDRQDALGLHHTLISLLIARGDFAGATSRIRRLATQGVANMDTSLLAVQAAVGTGNWAEATSLFNATTSHLPRHA